MLNQKDLKKETLFTSLNAALAQPEAVYKLKQTLKLSEIGLTSFENLKNLKNLTVFDRDKAWESAKNWAATLPNTKVVLK